MFLGHTWILVSTNTLKTQEIAKLCSLYEQKNNDNQKYSGKRYTYFLYFWGGSGWFSSG